MKHHLGEIPLQGDWVSKRNGYENDFASLIGAETSKRKLWDCVWEGLHLELKKGMSHTWLNLIPYSQYVLEHNNDDVITLFMFYKGNKIRKIYGLKMKELILALRLDEKAAKDITGLAKKFPNRLNIQCRLTENEIRRTANFAVPDLD